MRKVDNATEAAKTLQDITDTQFSSQTLCRHLESLRMKKKPVVKRKCPLLKPHHRRAQLEFRVLKKLFVRWKKIVRVQVEDTREGVSEIN